MAGYTLFPLHPRLADVVEAIWDTDVPEPGTARSIVLPLVSPILCFHHRAPPALCFHNRRSPAPNEWINSGRYRITGASGRAVGFRAFGKERVN